MMVRHIRLDRRQFYLFEGLGINSLNVGRTSVRRVLTQKGPRP
jgi:hypothetical protein